ncbi:MAG: hypothetical protein WCT04_14095 [Planctomycetota bacterium]
MATIARLPDIWKTSGKADIDGVLAAGHSPDELGRVFAGASQPDAFVNSLAEDERKALLSRIDKSAHSSILKESVKTVADKVTAAKLALRVGKAGDERLARSLIELAAEKGWSLGPIKGALNEGNRQRREQENERHIESGELSLLYDERHARAWFLDTDGLVEMKLDSNGRALITKLAGDPCESAVRATLNLFLQKARANGTRVQPQSLVTKPTVEEKLYVASEPTRLICLKPGAVEVVPNGINRDRVFILPAESWREWSFRADVDPRAACTALLDSVIGAWAISPTDRLFLLGLALCVFLLPLLPALGLVALSGLFGLGKTSIASGLGRLLNGVPVKPVAMKDDCVIKLAASVWLLFIDEAEPESVEKLGRVLNVLAKSGVGDPPASALPLLCAANLKLLPGTAQRAFILPVAKEHQQAVQLNDARYCESIAARRDEYLSAVMQLIAAKVLPAVMDGTLDQIVAELNANAADHPNQRNFHAIAAAYLIVNAIHEVAGRQTPDSLMAAWLKEQSERHLELAAGTSDVIAALEALNSAADAMSPEQFQKEYCLRFDRQSHAIQATAGQLLKALKMVDSNLKLGSSSELITTLKSNLAALEHKGWEVKFCAKKIHGHNVHVIRFPFGGSG